MYEHGQEPEPGASTPDPRSIWVYRYYKEASKLIGDGDRDDIRDIADGLTDYLKQVRRCYIEAGYDEHDVRFHLVAHSMGGLVARSYIQNPSRWCTEESHCIEKLFTYGTPHGGIEVKTFGNVGRLRIRNIRNFNKRFMAEYLGFVDEKAKKKEVDKVDVQELRHIDPSRVFCLIGTNHRDYDNWASRAAVGGSSDGLVKIANAYTRGSPRAMIHRAHSGPFGLVNSEEGYQHLRRFLFGDVRVDCQIVIEDAGRV